MNIETLMGAIVAAASDSELALLSSAVYEEKRKRTIKRIEENDIPLPTAKEVSEARKSSRTIQPIISYRDRTGFDLMTSKEVIEYFRGLPEDAIQQWKSVLA